MLGCCSARSARNSRSSRASAMESDPGGNSFRALIAMIVAKLLSGPASAL